jgi:hypothetical protein
LDRSELVEIENILLLASSGLSLFRLDGSSACFNDLTALAVVELVAYGETIDTGFLFAGVSEALPLKLWLRFEGNMFLPVVEGLFELLLVVFVVIDAAVGLAAGFFFKSGSLTRSLDLLRGDWFADAFVGGGIFLPLR